MCKIKFSTGFNIFQIDDKDITPVLIISEKSAQISKMDDASVSHPPFTVKFRISGYHGTLLLPDNQICRIIGYLFLLHINLIRNCEI